MVVSIFGYLFVSIGLLILVLPLILVELSRPRDWLIGGLFLFLGLFLLVENDLFRDSFNLFVVSMAILYGKMILEISQTRWYQLTSEEKNRIRSFQRWFESFQQLGQSFVFIGKSFLNFCTGLVTKEKKPLREKKWVHPELKEKVKKRVVDKSALTEGSDKIENSELPENEGNS